MSDQKESKVKGIKTGFIFLLLVAAFFMGVYIDYELPFTCSCVTAEGVR